MSFTTHSITQYAYSYTLSNNDVAAKMSLWKPGTGDARLIVADIYFMYDNVNPPAHFIQADQQYARLYLPLKTLSGLIDLLRNEKPLTLTLNPPFAFLGTGGLEPIGDGEPSTIFRPIVTRVAPGKTATKKAAPKKMAKKK